MGREYVKGEDGGYTPIADTQGIVRTTSYMVPDYAKRESTARIDVHSSPQALSWTVDRVGFAYLIVFLGSTVAGGIGSHGFAINGKAAVLAYAYGGAHPGASAIVPVKVGDVITVTGLVDNPGQYDSWFCYFIPPIFVTPPVPVVELGADYSLTEQPVMIDDGTGIRQKKDYDGRLIWERTFVGNIVAAAGVTVYLDIADGADIIEWSGWWQPGISNKLSVNRTTVGGIRLSGFATENGLLRFFTVSDVERTGTTNNAYRITVRYTKTA
jgi:hypothetical protein